MEICSGGIVGMGESQEDVLDLGYALRELGADSVPINFLDPRPGTPLGERPRVEPTYALRVLCAFRFLHARADLRVAAGRETVLRSLQAFALYPANSIFTSGYLTTSGNQPSVDHQMIRDLGFEIEEVPRKPWLAAQLVSENIGSQAGPRARKGENRTGVYSGK
jgi:biotin synthase